MQEQQFQSYQAAQMMLNQQQQDPQIESTLEEQQNKRPTQAHSPKEDYPTCESLASEGSSKGTTLHYVPQILNEVPAEAPSFQYRRNSSGNLVQVPAPTQNLVLQDYASQLFLLNDQNDRRLGRHQVLTGWQATISKQERLANVRQMYVL